MDPVIRLAGSMETICTMAQESKSEELTGIICTMDPDIKLGGLMGSEESR
jgi:hypothetical protein